jgi:hypothetical protein
MPNSFIDLTDEESLPQFVDVSLEQEPGHESQECASPEGHSRQEATQNHQEDRAQEDYQQDQLVLAQQGIAQPDHPQDQRELTQLDQQPDQQPDQQLDQQQDQQQDQRELYQHNLTQQASPQQESLQPGISQRSRPKSRQKSRKGQALDRELVKMRASLAEAHSKLIEQGNTLRLIYSICKGLERDITVVVSSRLGGTSLSTNGPPTNPTDVAETDAGPTDAAQTSLDPISTNTDSTGIISLNTGTLVAVEDTPAQTEMEENGNRRSRRKRPGNPIGLASKRARRA